jgi:quercetin dioxygenase-like cupin family protein
MNPITFESFEADARAQGFDEVVQRRWVPSAVVDAHTHPFALRALVVQGEMWLTVKDDVRHLRPGDTFALDREVPHSERYGAQGATYWVAPQVGPIIRRGLSEISHERA